MKLEDLLIKREEIPIFNDRCFIVPIHPKLLEPSTNLNPDIASNLFPEAAQQWYGDLQEYYRTLEAGQNKQWIQEVFLKQPQIGERYGRQYLVNLLGWEELVQTDNRGFATCLSVSRNAGGSLYLPSSEGPDWFGPRHVRFSQEKMKEYTTEQYKDIGIGRCYNHHNIDYYPGALFLRNWAILYLNAALTEALHI